MDSIIRQLFVRVHARYTCSPHVAQLAAFASWLLDHGYSVRYAQRLVFRAKRSLPRAQVSSDHVWSQAELVSAFSDTKQPKQYSHARYVFGCFLRSRGMLEKTASTNPHASLLAAYEKRLGELCGLAADTIKAHLWHVSNFLQWALRGTAISDLTAHRIEQYIEHRARRVSRRSLRDAVNKMRSFLRFCFDHKVIPRRLDEIERPVSFRDELLPRALSWPLIQRLLRSINRHDRMGWRDFMILHLMAHYGLRPGEITKLRLDSINWSEGTLNVEQSKTHSWLLLPLGTETIQLLRRYLQSRGNTASSTGLLFEAAVAPHRAMTKCTVSQVFRNRARRSALPLAGASAYSLRHSFAMRLFGRGVGIKAIGDLMGHSSPVSTAIYLRLQVDALREVALPVPSARSERSVA